MQSADFSDAPSGVDELSGTDIVFNCINSGSNPPDTVGEVGPNHYIQMTNPGNFQVFEHDGTTTGPVALTSLWDGTDLCGRKRKTVGADKNYDTRDFVKECRDMNITPHVARYDKFPGRSAIDGRTSRHESYQISQRSRKRVEESFGWGKTVGLASMTCRDFIVTKQRVSGLFI